MHVPREARGVVAIAAFDLGQLGFGLGVHREPFFRGEAGNVREEESGRKEERSLWFGVEGFDCPVGDLVVALILILMREKSPVHELHFAGGVDQFLLGEGSAGGAGSNVVELGVLFPTTVVAVVDFASGVGGVPVGLEMLWEGG